MTRAFLAKSLPVASLAFGLTLSGLVGPVAAQSSSRDQVLATLGEVLKSSGAKSVTWGRVDGDDARFTVTGSTMTSEAEGKTTRLDVQTITFVGAKPTSDGYSADEIDLDKVSMVADDGKMSVDRIVITKFNGKSVAALRASNNLGQTLDSFDATNIVVISEDGKTVPIAAIHGAASDYVDGIPRKGTFELKGLTVPIDPKEEGAKVLADLGYGNVSLDLAMTGSWDDKTGRLDYQQTTSGANMGALKVGFTIGGLTPAVIAKLNETKGDDAKQMELLQGLTVEKAAVRWDDASLTGRVLTQQAKEQGVDVPTYTKQIKVMLPMMLSMVGNKEFEKKVAAATGGFLDAPKSLTISVNPAQPLPVSQIMGAAMMAPQSLPTVLGADVKAND